MPNITTLNCIKMKTKNKREMRNRIKTRFLYVSPNLSIQMNVF